jgi:hypothetical protein
MRNRERADNNEDCAPVQQWKGVLAALSLAQHTMVGFRNWLCTIDFDVLLFAQHNAERMKGQCAKSSRRGWIARGLLQTPGNSGWSSNAQFA